MTDKLIALKDLVDQLCSEKPQCGGEYDNTFLPKYCNRLSSTLSKIIKTTTICTDEIHSHLEIAMRLFQTELTQAQAAQKLTVVPFTIKLIMEIYQEWVEEVKRDKITAMKMGSSAKPVTGTGVTFTDIIGMEKEKTNIIAQFVYPYRFPQLFPNKPKGMLMYGLPGTGKTLLVKALASELKNVALFSPAPSEFKGKYEGETEKKIMAIYKEASNLLNAPIKKDINGKDIPKPLLAIIFIDEADTLFGAGRESDPSKQRTVNTFLQVMDGINTDKRIVTIAATNYPYSIDDAISRRLPVKIFVDMPTDEMRRNIILEKMADRYNFPDFKGNRKTDRTQFWENLINYGVSAEEGGFVQSIIEERETETEKSGLFGRKTTEITFTKHDTRKPDMSITNEIIDGILKQVGPKFENASYFNKKTKKEAAYEGALSEIGYTLADLSSALDKAFNNASLRATASDGTFEKIGNYWVYNAKDSKAKPSSPGNPTDKEKITFDITLEDIIDGLKSTPSSAKLSSYKELLSYSRNEPRESDETE
jgi:SpoVK/Ycf46/Vps4 family AAA+-type ATPase